MFVINQIIDEEIIYIAVCDVCGLPFEEEMDHSYHIHNSCYWGLDFHAPSNEESFDSLGFKEYK